MKELSSMLLNLNSNLAGEKSIFFLFFFLNLAMELPVLKVHVLLRLMLEFWESEHLKILTICLQLWLFVHRNDPLKVY